MVNATQVENSGELAARSPSTHITLKLVSISPVAQRFLGRIALEFLALMPHGTQLHVA